VNIDPVAAAIHEAEHAEAETRYRLQLAREMYQAGYAAAEADMDRRWNTIAHAAVHGPSHAELEERRWGPGGRAHFADPRPGDFLRRAAKHEPEQQAEPEMEAGT
jgi:hypothetical protein